MSKSKKRKKESASERRRRLRSTYYGKEIKTEDNQQYGSS